MENLEPFQILMAMDANYMPPEYDGDIFHYTSPMGFQSILFGDKFDAIIWASRYDCLNDVSEGTVAEEILKEAAKELYENREITKEVYELFTSIKTSQTIMLYCEVEGTFSVRRRECDRYVCSFSKNRDSLAMWNYYSKGNKYEGFNIGFNAQSLKKELESLFIGKETNFHIYPVIYKKDEQIRIIKRSLLKLKDFYSEDNISIIQNILSTRLIDWGLIFKKEYFEHEEEVRIIIDLSKTENNIAINYRMNAGYVIPYIKVKMEKYTVSHVNFGPLLCNGKNTESQVLIMEEMLKRNGYALVKIDYSKIPIRY